MAEPRANKENGENLDLETLGSPTQASLLAVSATDDKKFLDLSGLGYVWEKIDGKKQDKLVAGDNITISGNRISATSGGANYTAGTGIDITRDVISVDDTIATVFDLQSKADSSEVNALRSNISSLESTKQDKLTSGTNIKTINGTSVLGSGNITTPNTTYTGSDGVKLTGTNFTADTSVLATKNELKDYAKLSDIGDIGYSAGEHIKIENDVISATGYVASSDPVSAGEVVAVVTNDMVSKNTLTFDRTKPGEFVSITVSTSDIGSGAPLAANSLYGVYR